MTGLVRFAPSPTGLLHVGNARTAMLNFLFAKKEGARFFLRIDDTDTERSKPEFEAAIIEDLGWLGITHDLFARQVERADAHRAAAEKLKAAGRLYPAYETADELDRRRKRQIAMHKPPVYDRAALALTDADRAKLEAEGRKPHWRFRLSQTKVKWRDLLRGDVEIDTATLVRSRADPRGRPLSLYLAVRRRRCRFRQSATSSAARIMSPTPRRRSRSSKRWARPCPLFAHFPLLVGAGGEALSKRLGSLSLRSLREDGIEPLALDCYLAKIGTSDPIELSACRSTRWRRNFLSRKSAVRRRISCLTN